MPPHDTRKTADAYWGTGPKLPPAQRDPHGLGEPPRDLTPPLQRYCKRATPSLFALWVILSVFFGGSHLLMMVAIPETRSYIPLLPLLFIGLAVYTGRKLSERRKRIRFVLREGRFTDAVVRDLRAVEHHYGRRTVIDYHVTFDLGDRTVTLITRDPGASLLQIGLQDQVLWHEKEPDLVVPTYLVAS